MPKHYKYSPSSTKRWMTCPGSVALSDGMPRVDSVYALEGTKAHAVAEKSLLEHIAASGCDEETREAVQMYLDEIAAIESAYKIIVRFTERKLVHTEIDNFGGTTDHFVVYIDGDKIVLHVFDYKHGVGVPVPVVENVQVLSYFAIIASRYPDLIDLFRATIVQPRSFAGDAIQHWECDVERVRKHETDVRAAMQDTTTLVAGEHCRWCLAAVHCPCLTEHAFEAAKLDFEVIKDDSATLARLYELTPAITGLLKKIPMAMMNLFRDGSGVEGYKVVAKRASNRQWVLDQEETLQALQQIGISRESVLLEPELKSPTKVEAAIKDKDVKKKLAELVVRRPTGFKVVPITEKGEPVQVDTAVTDFEVIEDDDE